MGQYPYAKLSVHRDRSEDSTGEYPTASNSLPQSRAMQVIDSPSALVGEVDWVPNVTFLLSCTARSFHLS